MNLKLLLTFVLVVVTTAHAYRLPQEMDNSISASKPVMASKDWVEVTMAPPVRVAKHGSQSVELECEVIGQPTPSVQWVHGSVQLSNFDDFDTNLISESSPNSLTRVRARIIIDHPINTERTYTCVGKAGGQTTFTSTVVYAATADDIDQPAEGESTSLGLLGTKLMNNLKPARILNYYVSIFETIGASLIIPCRSTGRPRTEVYWLNEIGSVITSQQPRFKTLPTGELIITSLRWSDMGMYTCVAKNAIAKDTISTFVYPMKADDV